MSKADQPGRDELQSLTRDELRDLARQRRIRGFGSMRKSELVQALARDNRDSSRKTSPASRPATPPAGMRRLATDEHLQSDEILAEPLDNRWFRVSWGLSPATLERAVAGLGAEWHRAKPVLRLYRVTVDDAGPRAKSRAEDIDLPVDSQQWFVNLKTPGGTWQVELGYLSSSGRYFKLLHAQPITLPDSPAGRRREVTLSRVDTTTMGDHSTAVPLDLEAELVLSGQTLSLASLSIGDEAISVEPDGSFRSRRPLHEGRTVIPIDAHAGDAGRQRILLAIERNTRYLDPESNSD